MSENWKIGGSCSRQFGVEFLVRCPLMGLYINVGPMRVLLDTDYWWRHYRWGKTLWRAARNGGH